MKKSNTAAAIGLATAALAAIFAALPAHSMDDQVFINTPDIKWSDAPPTLPKGAKIAVLYGDPGKPGPFTLRLATPANYKIAAHWHSQTENLTIISGTLYLGMGDKLVSKDALALKAGGYHYLPAKMHHYAFNKVPTVIQVSGEGPFDINYLDPKYNPAAAR